MSLIDTTPGGVSGQSLGIDAIREFNVVTDTYSAAYGKKAGGQVSIVTASGTNAFHGNLFEFLRNSAVDARNFFDQRNVPPFKRNSFGASGGGPVRKDRTFIFGNYEGFRQRLGLSNLAVVPDDDARRGFLPDPAHAGQLMNVGLAPGVAPYFILWPEPNGAKLGDGTAYFFSNPKQQIGETFFTARMDHTFSERDVLSGVYTFDTGTSILPQIDPLTSLNLAVRDQVFSLQEVHTFSPNTINTFRSGFSRGYWATGGSVFVTVPPDLSVAPGQVIPGLKIGGAIIGGATTIASAGLGNSQTKGVVVRNVFTYDDQLQIVKGAHLVTLGAWFERVQVNSFTPQPTNGQLSFSTLQDFMQGKLSSVQIAVAATEMGYRQWEGAWLVQDDIKLRPNLTVNLGLRHEFTNGWNEVGGRNANYVQGPDGTLLTDPRIATSLFTQNNAKKLFSPRAGLAWDPFGKGKTSVNAGFGIYYNLLDHIQFCCQSNPPFNLRITLQNVAFPIHIVPGTPFPGALPTPIGILTDFHTPTVIKYNFKIPQQIAPNLALNVAYIGNHGYHDIQNADLNAAIPIICHDAQGNCPAGLAEGTKFVPAGVRRRNPALSMDRSWLDGGHSNYNALQVDVTRRFSHGLQFRGNYTFSKNLANFTPLQSGNATSTAMALLDADDPGRDWGRSVYDIRNQFSFSANYELSFGNGKALLNAAGGFVGKIVSGWQLNTIVSVRSGLPFTPILAANHSRNGGVGGGERPSMAPGRTLHGIYLESPGRWFDPTVFALPVAGTYGNVGNTVLTQPGAATFDVSLFKKTHITERTDLQFRAEIFNVLNRANFGLPSNIVLNPNGSIPGSAGTVTNTSTSSRQIQFGLKFIF